MAKNCSVEKLRDAHSSVASIFQTIYGKESTLSPRYTRYWDPTESGVNASLSLSRMHNGSGREWREGGLKPSTASSLARFMPASWHRRPPSLSESLHLFLVVSRDSLVRSFVSPLFGISLGLFPSFLPRILICRRPSCSGATKEREGETETSVPFFLLSSDKKPQDRPRPNLFLYMYHVSYRSLQ